MPDEPNATREIDVLITKVLAGKEIKVAIECKNYKGRVSIDEIEKFISRLEDLRIPPQHGIFVAINGYASGAIRRAKKEGIGTLLLDGLTADRLRAEVHESFQSVVYLLLDVTQITVVSEAGEEDAWQLLWFQDSAGQFCGGLLDIIWAKWRDGEIPRQLGEHELSLDVPPGWYWSTGGTTVPNTAKAKVQVIGFVVTDTGRAERFVLRDAQSGDLERVKIQSTFDADFTMPRALPVEPAFSEIELEELLTQPAVARISIGRVPFPRIRYRPLYWPPSQRAARIMDNEFQQRVRIGLQR